MRSQSSTLPIIADRAVILLTERTGQIDGMHSNLFGNASKGYVISKIFVENISCAVPTRAETAVFWRRKLTRRCSYELERQAFNRQSRGVIHSAKLVVELTHQPDHRTATKVV